MQSMNRHSLAAACERSDSDSSAIRLRQRREMLDALRHDLSEAIPPFLDATPL